MVCHKFIQFYSDHGMVSIIPTRSVVEEEEAAVEYWGETSIFI